MSEQPTYKVHTRNTVFNALAEGMWGFAFAFHNMQSVIPVFLATLGASAWLIGMIPGGFVILLALPQLASATVFRGYLNVKKLNLLLHMALAPFALGMVIFFFFLEMTGPKAILLYMLMFIGYSLAIGVLVPVWADFLASVTVASRRGRFFGITFTANALMGMVGGYCLKLILESGRYTFPANFGLGWLIMVIGITIGTSFFFFMKTINEPKVPDADQGRWWQRILRIYTRNPNFRQYIYSRMFGAAAMMPVAFYAIDIQARYDLPVSSVGSFTFFLVFGTAIFNYLLGYLGDTVNRKLSVSFYFTGHILALLVALFLDHVWAGYLIFFIIGMANGSMQSSFMVFVYEFAGESGDRKLHYAALDTAVAPVLFLFISVAGLIVESYGYSTLYYIALASMLAGLGLFVFKVRQPTEAAG